MGTGKTVVSKELSKKLNKEYISTDSLIVKKAGKIIPRVFNEDGEIKFRELEVEVIKEVSIENNLIIDCGGGVVLNKINIDRLNKNSIVVLLKSSPKSILTRILKEKDKRPLLEVPNTMEKIEQLLNLRKPFYENSSKYTIDTSNMRIDEVVDEIVEILKSEVEKKNTYIQDND